MTQESILVSLRIQACLKRGALPPRFSPAPASDTRQGRARCPQRAAPRIRRSHFCSAHLPQGGFTLLRGIFCGLNDLSIESAVTCNPERNNVPGDFCSFVLLWSLHRNIPKLIPAPSYLDCTANRFFFSAPHSDPTNLQFKP